MLALPHPAPVTRRGAALPLILAVAVLTALGAMTMPAPRTAVAAWPEPGTAVTTSPLTLFAGPSVYDWSLGFVPPGSAVVLTGVSQDGFYYVVYEGQPGWLWAADLATTGDPGADPYGYTTDQIIQMIYDAAWRYGQSGDDMLRVARCESWLDPTAVNPSGSYGLFQFVPSTWASTPYANHDIFDAWANANAAAWMWSVGRRGEWVCQ